MFDWNKINTVMLDMDGTLLDLNFDNHFWQEFVPIRYAWQNNITLEQARHYLQPLFKSMEGKLEWYCLDYWSEVLKLDIVALKNEVSNLIAVLPHVIDFLEVLRDSPRRVLLVTNAHPDSLGLKMERTCLQTYFDAIISSHQFGMPKEHVSFWTRLQQSEGFVGRKTLLVDDSLPVLLAAKQFGIRHLIAVSKPDSMRQARQINEFPSIADFRELLYGV